MTKVTKQYFSAASKVYAASTDSLADIIRKLAQDLARMRTDQIADMVDSSTGTAAYPAVAPVLLGTSLTPFTETGTASAQDAATDTAIGKIKNAHSVIAAYLNTLNAPLGLPLITDSSGGTVATPGTIAALDLSVTGVNTACLNVVTAKVTFGQLKTNAARLVGYANRVLVAIGESKITNSTGGTFDAQPLGAITATGASVDGTALSTVTAAQITLELAAHANVIATIAKALTDSTGAQLTDLTDSTTGSASASALTVMTIPSVAVAGAATTSSPKAGFDTNLANAEDGIAELGLYVNNLIRRNNLSTTLLTDSTSVTTNGTLPAITQNLTAVDGSSGSSAVDFTTAVVRMGLVNNAIASLAAKVNVLAPLYGVPTITDSSGGVASNTLADIAATGAGTSGAASTILDTVADAYWVSAANNLASLAAKINAMVTSTNTGANLTTEIPLQVVAWDA